MKKKTIYKKENGDFCCKKIISQQGKSTTRERTFIKIIIEFYKYLVTVSHAC